MRFRSFSPQKQRSSSADHRALKKLEMEPKPRFPSDKDKARIEDMADERAQA